jgi:phosphatidylserine decarboxylase
MNTPLPPKIRVWMYKAFGYFYGVNFEEIKEDLNSFRTFN